MAKTKISDIIDPEIIQDFSAELLPEKSAFINSGAVDTSVKTGIENGGSHLTMSYIAEDGTDMEELSETGDLTPRALTETAELGVVVRRGEAVSIGDIAEIVMHRDANMALAQRFTGKAGKSIDNSLISVAVGATPSANTHDIAVSSGTQVYVTAENVIDGGQKLGDQQDALALMIMHSVVYSRLLKANLIDFIPDSEQKPIPFYLGKLVIVSDRCPVDTSTPEYYEYTTFLVGRKAMVLDYQRELNVEHDRDILDGGGTDIIAGTVHYLPHLKGVGFTSTIVKPSEAQLQDTGNWTLKRYSAKGVKIVKLVTN